MISKRSRKFLPFIFLIVLAIGLYWATQPFDTASNLDSSVRGSSVNGLAPDFSGTTVDGENIRISDYRGKIVLVNLFASWCGPCLAETPHLVEIDNDNQGDLIILGMNFQETPKSISGYRKDFDISYPLVLDPEGSFFKLYRSVGLPTSWFIDPEGVIRYIHNGPMTATMIRKVLDDIRAGKQPDPFTSG